MGQRGLTAPRSGRSGEGGAPSRGFLPFVFKCCRQGRGHCPVRALAEPPGPGREERLVAVDAEARRPRPPRRGRPPARPASARFSGQQRAERLVPGPAEALVAPWTWPPCNRPHRHPRTPVAEDTAAGHGPVPRRPLRQPLVGGLGAQGRRCLPRSPLLTHPPTWGPCSLPSSTRGSPPVPAITFGVPAPHSQVGMLKPGPSSHPPAPPASAAHMCGDAGCRQPGLPRMWGGASLGASRQRGPRVSPQGKPHCAPAWSRRGPPRSGRVRTAARCWGRSRGRRGGRGGDGVGRACCGPAAPAWGPQSSPLQRPHLGPGKVRLASPAPSSSAEGPHPWDPGPLPPGNTGHVHFRPHRPAGVGKRVLPTCPAWVSIETPSETWGPENTLHSPHLIPMVTPRMSRPPRMTLSRSSGLWRSNNFPEPPRPRRARSEGAPSSRMWPPPFASETGSAPFSAWGVGWGRGVQIG